MSAIKKVVVVSAGLRTPSTTRLLADDLAAQVMVAAGDAGVGVDVTHVEVRDHAHALADTMLTGFATGDLKAALAQVQGADALIVVSPTFSANYSGLFKLFFDALEADETTGLVFDGTPVLLAATGGTERHSLMLDFALRPLFSYLGAEPLRTGVYAATSDFGGEASARLAGRIRRAGAELVGVLAGAAAPTVADEPEITPFAEMLARVNN